MNVDIDIAYASGGDWVGLYVDGTLFWSVHTIEPEHIRPYVLGRTVTHFDEWYERGDVTFDPHLDNWGNDFPVELDTIRGQFYPYWESRQK